MSTKQSVPKLIMSQRNRAYKEGFFPEHGGFWFLRDTFRRHPAYSRLLASMKLGATLVDMSDGLHEELRHLAADGAPTDKMWAIGTNPRMWEISKELFGEDVLKDSQPGGVKPLGPPFEPRFVNQAVEYFGFRPDCKRLRGKVDLIIANHIFNYIEEPYERHIFTVANQMSRPGTVFMGMHIGCTSAFISEDDQFFFDNIGFGHYLDFRKLAKTHLDEKPRNGSNSPAQDWKVVVHEVVDLESWGLLEQEWEWIKPRNKTQVTQLHGVFWALERVK